MSTQHITKRLVARLKPEEREFIVWDTILSGFGVRVQKTGAMAYVVKYRPGSGGRSVPTKRLTLGKVGTLEVEEARSLAKKTLASVAHGADPAAVKAADKRAATLADVAERFLEEHVKAKRAISTASSYKSILDRLVLPELGAKKAGKITTAEVQRLHSRLKDKPYQANRLLRVLSSLYTFAAKDNAVPDGFNPCQKVEFFREETRERYLTSEELKRFGDAVREAETIGLPYEVDETKPSAKHASKAENRLTIIGPYAAAALRLLIFTGARLREILHLEWEHIDFQRGQLRLAKSKTGKKWIVLNVFALDILQSLPRGGKYVIAGDDADRPRADLKRPWEAVRNRAGLDGVRLHDLRHTHASTGAGAGLGLPIIGKLLGHTQAATTQRYAHLDIDPLRRASDHIGDQLNRAMGGPEMQRAPPSKRRSRTSKQVGV
jgi:integrase